MVSNFMMSCQRNNLRTSAPYHVLGHEGLFIFTKTIKQTNLLGAGLFFYETKVAIVLK